MISTRKLLASAGATAVIGLGLMAPAFAQDATDAPSTDDAATDDAATDDAATDDAATDDTAADEDDDCSKGRRGGRDGAADADAAVDTADV